MFREELFFLSNFYLQEFYCGILNQTVKSSEHAFMALKTEDPTEQAYVLDADSPGQAKRRGRSVSLRSDWDFGARVWAMQTVLRDKFSIPELGQKLVDTGSLFLVEENDWHDQFWGNCSCSAHATTPGTNMLGELLMALRFDLQG